MTDEQQMITCCKCHGKGVYDVAAYNESGEIIGWNPTLCEVCHGTGKISLQFYEDLQRGVQGKMTKHEQIKAMTVDQFANYLLNNGFGLLKEISKEQTPDQWRYWMEHFVNWLNSETELDPKELEKCTEWRT